MNIYPQGIPRAANAHVNRQVIQNLCAAKDSITLKSICNTLSCKTRTLDIIMLFSQPSLILQPLCELLNQWQDNEEQSTFLNEI